MKVQGDRKATVWFIVGFLVVATAAVIVAAATSGGDPVLGNEPAPEISDADWTRGSREATVSLIEYGDFQCPACASYYPVLKRLMAEYGDRILFVSRNFPLYSIHPNAGISAQAAEAAGLQGKYWEMFDMLYENQRNWSSAAPNRVVEQYFNGYAQSLDLDMERFADDINSDEVLRKIQADVDGAISAGVNSTPTFFVNMLQIQSPASYDQFKSIIDAALEQA